MEDENGPFVAVAGVIVMFGGFEEFGQDFVVLVQVLSVLDVTAVKLVRVPRIDDDEFLDDVGIFFAQQTSHL